MKMYRVLANFVEDGKLYEQGKFINSERTKLSAEAIEERLRWEFLWEVPQSEIANIDQSKVIKIKGRPRGK